MDIVTWAYVLLTVQYMDLISFLASQNPLCKSHAFRRINMTENYHAWNLET